MPRTVRNFWVTGSCDGMQKQVGFGPRAKDGNAEVTVHMRHKGSVTTPVVIEGIARWDGTLLLRVTINGNVTEHVTNRD